MFGKGVIPLLHPDHHDFRDRDKSKEKDKTGLIVKTYLLHLSKEMLRFIYVKSNRSINN